MRKPVKIELDGNARRRLLRLRADTRDSRMFVRISIILSAADGMTAEEIARALHVSRATVALWRSRWICLGLPGLYDRQRVGGQPKATPDYVRLLLKTVKRPPRAAGFPFNHWTTEKLSRHLERLTGIVLCAERVRQILRAHPRTRERSYLVLPEKHNGADPGGAVAMRGITGIPRAGRAANNFRNL